MDITFTTAAPSSLDADLLVVVVRSDYAAELASLDGALGGHLLPLLASRKFKGAAGSVVATPTLGRIAARELAVVGAGDGSRTSLVTAAGTAGREARERSARTVAIAGTGELGGAATAEAFAAGNYAYEAYRKEDDRSPPVERLALASSGDAGHAGVRAKWQAWARDLVNAPPAELYPETLAAAAQELGALANVTVEVMDEKQLAAANYVGVIAVGQGSTRPPRVAHVRYRPPGAKAHVALVGKGVTFDSGGHSLKPSSGMQTMRCDMGGAATMLGAIAIVAELGLPVAVDCVIGCVENALDGNAYKLGDILRYRNGVNVEIHNTDAEGRLVLADCLIKACEEPGITHLVDAATLTGAAAIALGPDLTGVFTNEDDLAAELAAAADAEGEGLWRLPLHVPYKRMLKADWGDIKNVGGREAGATTAALFLSHFVKDGVKWAHLDIAPTAFVEKKTRYYAAGATGMMVRSLATWMAGKGA